jgi:uncharacterized protein with NAD-binding domain and iron-sulfur cluster
VTGRSEREKVAVLGGGPAGIAAAFELTATPELRERFAVTVYQPGWRLGGKCASGRNVAEHSRIEEHGLHLWFGFYDNAFKLMRSTYDALNESDALRRPSSHPLATFEKAFTGADELVLYDRQGEDWTSFAFKWPPNAQAPGGDYPLPDVWELAQRACEWAVAQWHALMGGPAEATGRPRTHRSLTPGWLLDVTRGLAIGAGLDADRGGEHLLHLALHYTRAYRTASRLSCHRPPMPGVAKLELAAEAAALRVLAGLIARFRDWMWDHVVAEHCEEDAHLRLFFTMFDTFASALAGVSADGVLDHGWGVINDRDLCEWLSAHGARQVTVGATPTERSPLLRAVYDVAFAYPAGVLADANAAAGTAMNDLLRLAFTYRGHLFYRMTAGMGDTVFTPLYELLNERGVEFRFFHAVTNLGLSADGRRIEKIEVIPQVELEQPRYDPLITVKRLRCWPSEPLWGQLKDGEELRRRKVNFELSDNPLERGPLTLRRGAEFDSVVLGIPVGALAGICGQVAERHERFAKMLASAATVRTQAVQLWLTKTTPQLGWPYGVEAITTTFVEPMDTWCDMSHLLVREKWGGGARPRGVAYLCGVLDDRDEDNATATARVKENARTFMEASASTLWPGSATDRDRTFDWSLLVSSAALRGPARLDAQYWRANTTGSERYVLTPAKSVLDRLAADESGVENLVLAGDWTRNGIDGGCVEAAVTSGMQAARALIGHERRFTGESATWLSDGRSRRGRGGRGVR